MIRRLSVLLVVLLTIYAPIELTRISLGARGVVGNLAAWKLATLGLRPTEYVPEVIFIWTFYLSAMILVWRLAWQKQN